MLTALPHITPGSVLLRLHAEDASWIDRLPAAPTAVTVTVDRRRLADVPVDELVAKGYRIAGIVASGDDAPGVDLLVPAATQASDPAWWTDVLRAADRAYDLDMGPARLLLAERLRVHCGAHLTVAR